ncbi:MAG: response regulator [Planctomycetota bacterium]
MANILVVEDDPMSADFLRLCLERKGGYQVRVSINPAQVLETVKELWPTVILMDVSLGGAELEGRAIDGLELTRRVRAIPGAAKIPVILFTAHAMAGDRERLLTQSGADDYVTKPIADYRLFLQKLRTFVVKNEPPP